MSELTTMTPADAAPDAAPDSTAVSPERRRAILAQVIQQSVTQGARVESQGENMAVLVTGKPVNHLLHLILTIITGGLWLLIWILVAVTGGEKRELVTVDEFGNVLRQKATK